MFIILIKTSNTQQAEIATRLLIMYVSFISILNQFNREGKWFNLYNNALCEHNFLCVFML